MERRSFLSATVKTLAVAALSTATGDIHAEHLPTSSEYNLDASWMELGGAVLDIGYANSLITVFKDGNLVHQRSIPFGSKLIYDTVQIFANLELSDARALVEKHGIANEKEVTYSELLTPPSGEARTEKLISRRWLAANIQLYLEKIFLNTGWVLTHSGYYRELESGLIITGELCRVPGVRELAEFCLGMDCKTIAFKDII